MAANNLYNNQVAYDQNRQLNDMAYDMPGYSQMFDLYNNRPDDPTYGGFGSGLLDPNQFASGGYGPIGADQLIEFGEGAYDLFDKFVPGMEYIAENQGVGEQELANMLGESSSGFQQNMANQQQQQERNMGRMGMNPNSGAWAEGAGGRAMQGAAGLSGLQQGVRNDARQQDWSERMQAAGIGLNAGGMGTEALKQGAGAYGQAYGDYLGHMGNMAGLTENARQYNLGYGSQLASGLSGARPAMDETNYGQRSSWSELLS